MDARPLRDVFADLTGGDGTAHPDPAAVLQASGHPGLPAGLVAEAVGSYADSAPIEVAEHLSPYVMAHSAVPMPDAPEVDPGGWLAAVTGAPASADLVHPPVTDPGLNYLALDGSLAPVGSAAEHQHVDPHHDAPLHPGDHGFGGGGDTFALDQLHFGGGGEATNAFHPTGPAVAGADPQADAAPATPDTPWEQLDNPVPENAPDGDHRVDPHHPTVDDPGHEHGLDDPGHHPAM